MGKAGWGRRGSARVGRARQVLGLAGKAVQRFVTARLVLAQQGRLGQARSGEAGLGMAGEAKRDEVG